MMLNEEERQRVLNAVAELRQMNRSGDVEYVAGVVFTADDAASANAIGSYDRSYVATALEASADYMVEATGGAPARRIAAQVPARSRLTEADRELVVTCIDEYLGHLPVRFERGELIGMVMATFGRLGARLTVMGQIPMPSAAEGLLKLRDAIRESGRAKPPIRRRVRE